MDTLKCMKVFRAIVEKGSFVKASEFLDMSPPMTSKYLANLESHLQTKLFNRNNRNQALTEAGQAYYFECINILDSLETAEIAARHGSTKPQGTLKITAPVWLASPYLAKMTAHFSSHYPDIKLDLHLDNEVNDLIEGGFDLALRASHRSLADNVIAVPLTTFVIDYVASPTYLKNHGTPETYANLANHKGLMPRYTNLETQLPTTHLSNNTLMLYEMAKAHMGIAALPDWVTRDAIKHGELIKLFPVFSEPVTLYAVYMDRKLLSNKVRTVIDYLKHQAKVRYGFMTRL